MSERGAYRSIPNALLGGPDFRRLSERARWIFVLLKMNVGAAGIDVWYPDELIARLTSESGASADDVGAALRELEESEWIRRAENVVWVVGQLEHDPHLRVSDPKHRKGVQRHVAGLPRINLVRAFVESSKGWIPKEEGSSMGLAWAFEGASKGLRSKKQRQDKNKDKNKNDIADAPGGASALDLSDPPPDQPVGDDDLPATKTSWVAILGDDYKAVTAGLPNYAKIGKLLKPAVDAYGLDRVRSAWKTFCASEARKYGPAYFVERFGDYEPRLVGVGGALTAEEYERLNRG